jgi:hypothetical protein
MRRVRQIILGEKTGRTQGDNPVTLRLYPIGGTGSSALAPQFVSAEAELLKELVSIHVVAPLKLVDAARDLLLNFLLGVFFAKFPPDHNVLQGRPDEVIGIAESAGLNFLLN